MLQSWPITFYCACDHISSTTCQKRICADFLLNNKLLRNQSGLRYHYPSLLLHSNPGRLRSIVVAIMDRKQLAYKRIYLAFLLNDDLLCNQSGLYYHYPSKLLHTNLGQLRSIVLEIMDRVQLAQKRIWADFLLNNELLHN